MAGPPPAVMVSFLSRPDCISRRLDRRSAWSRNQPNCSVTVLGGLPRLLPTLATLPRATRPSLTTLRPDSRPFVAIAHAEDDLQSGRRSEHKAFLEHVR